MTVTLQRNVASTFLLVANDGQELLVQFDWDFPSIASSFGWQSCPCGGTDGTIDCAHRKRSAMIAEAWDFLIEHDGESINDPGYFYE